MLKNLISLALVAMIAGGIGYAAQNQPADKVVVQAPKTSPASGKQMYVSYCAPCHGVDGRGNGPIASSLVQRPADLAVLSKNNGGKFPSTHVVSVLQFGITVSAHGNAEMPIWGPVFSNMNPTNTQKDVIALRVSNLTRYLDSLQVK
jgi:mono/diheme cytochrome c family protein